MHWLTHPAQQRFAGFKAQSTNSMNFSISKKWCLLNIIKSPDAAVLISEASTLSSESSERILMIATWFLKRHLVTSWWLVHFISTGDIIAFWQIMTMKGVQRTWLIKNVFAHGSACIAVGGYSSGFMEYLPLPCFDLNAAPDPTHPNLWFHLHCRL